jgi:signal peptidase I
MRIITFLLKLLSSICFGLIIAVLVNMFLFQPTTVMGHSMEPTLADQSRIYVSKLPRLVKYEPKFGDIVIIDSRVNHPRTWKDDIKESLIMQLLSQKQEHNIWVKRVIGLPGDTIEFKNNKVYRNGKLLYEPYIKEEMRNTPNRTIHVPKGYIFVMGDNRNFSKDSRDIGCIPIDHVIGVKLF